MGLASSSRMSESKDQAEVVLVGCGCPLRGMGWYHAVQMLGGECPSAKLSYIVEPWFLGPGALVCLVRINRVTVDLFHDVTLESIGVV
jgi:hypothetical protein